MATSLGGQQLECLGWHPQGASHLPANLSPARGEEGPAAPPLSWGLETGPGLGWAPP